MVARHPSRRKTRRPTRYISSTFSITFSKVLEADLGLAPVEKSIQNRIYYGNGVAVTEMSHSGPAVRDGHVHRHCGGVSGGSGPTIGPVVLHFLLRMFRYIISMFSLKLVNSDIFTIDIIYRFTIREDQTIGFT